MSVNPKVIDTPPVTAVAKDGFSSLQKPESPFGKHQTIVGGAGEETILARVGEGLFHQLFIRQS
jgi:uncharacterized protein YqfA (UPF0365 family)